MNTNNIANAEEYKAALAELKSRMCSTQSTKPSEQSTHSIFLAIDRYLTQQACARAVKEMR